LAAFDEFLLVGPANNLTFLRSLMELDEFREARIDTQLIEREAGRWTADRRHHDLALAIATHVFLSGGAADPSAGDGKAAMPTPWETLGGWRLGAGGGERA
ncbi:MAG: Biotin carboxylase C-terminal domain, partial [Candidatus Binatota bacterium]|nr:Biotin carboxylase C-terminal domain [Candidatus Binatota bacterium]